MSKSSGGYGDATFRHGPSFLQPFGFQYSGCLFSVTEFRWLYGRPPGRIDGDQHIHLFTNILLDDLLPAGTKVRRNFSFNTGEKSFINRLYRKIVDHRLRRQHQITDYFFALSQHLEPSRLQRVVLAARTAKVELMTHPQVDAEYKFLLGDDFADAIYQAQSGGVSNCKTMYPMRSCYRECGKPPYLCLHLHLQAFQDAVAFVGSAQSSADRQ